MGSYQCFEESNLGGRTPGKIEASLNEKLQEVKWGEYKLEDLFEKLNLGFRKETFDKANDISTTKTDDFCLPLVNAKDGNNGIMYYGREEDFESAELTIDIVNDGAISTGNVYSQPQKTGVLYNAYLIKPLFESNANILHFFACAIQKSIKTKYGYENKAGWAKVKQEKIQLPIKNNEIDFGFIESFISELKAQRIAELEAYLTLSGLKDCVLTKQEEEALKRYKTIPLKNYKIVDLFEPLKGRRKLSKAALTENGAVPVFSSDTTNNGIMGYTNLNADYIVEDSTPLYLIFGDHTRAMDIAKSDFCVMDNVKVLVPKIQSLKTILFICAAWKKTIPNLGYARHWNVAKDCIFRLPVKNGKLDIVFIENLITAVQKLIIKDVFEYN